jgi:uncharacterized protein
MKRLINKHKEAVLKWTKLDFEAIQKVKYLYEFDREVQSVHPSTNRAEWALILSHRCPTWGYPTEEAYYRDASSTDAVLAIRIPFLAISARDDPVGNVPRDFLRG